MNLLKNQTRARVLATLAILIGFIGIVHYSSAHVRITTDLNWSEHIRPIMREKCMSCHHPGGMAPDYINLTVYGNRDGLTGARDWAQAIEEEIMTGRMPPWRADERFGKFANARRLSAEEKDMIIGWIQGGAPQGPQRGLAAPEEFQTRDWILGEPDLALEMSEAHAIPKDAKADRITVTLPVEIDEDQWITGYEFYPGDPGIVHTMTAFIVEPEGTAPATIDMEIIKPYDPLVDEDDLEEIAPRTLAAGRRFLGQWTRGDAPVFLPDEGGKLLRTGSTIELEITYRKQGFEAMDKAFEDRSKLGLFFATEDTHVLVETIRIENDSFNVPAGENAVKVEASFTVPENMHLLSLFPQMGPLASRLEVRATYPDGLTQTLLFVPEFKSKFATSFVFADSIPAPEGTVLEVVAHYDNSSENYDNPNYPPIDVGAGAGPLDEQLLVYVDYHPDDFIYVATPTPTPRPRKEGGGMVPIAGAEREPTAPSQGPLSAGNITNMVREETGADLDSGAGLFENAINEVARQAADEAEGIVADEGGEIETQVASASPSALLSLTTEIYWCPMRGNPCPIHDHHGPGNCPECGMALRPKSWFVEKYKDQLAARKPDANLTKAGTQEDYWAVKPSPEGGVDITKFASLEEAAAVGVRAYHKSRFTPVREYVSMTEGSECYGRIYYSPGLCPVCLEPVQSTGHMDHTPLHGGLFIMADNLYHHLEATLPSTDEMRLYFYNDFKEPLDPRNFKGRVVIESFDEEADELIETEIPLVHKRELDPYLVAELGGIEEYPFAPTVFAWLAGEEKRFDFPFDALTVEPEPDAEFAVGRLHAHGEREAVEIPATPGGVIEEILKRDAIIRDRIAAEKWFEIHTPAFDAKDLAEALREMDGELSGRDRNNLRKAVDRIKLAADRLDRAGDTSDAPRVKRYYKEFAKAVAEIQALFGEK